jgi:hypothetical protein
MRAASSRANSGQCGNRGWSATTSELTCRLLQENEILFHRRSSRCQTTLPMTNFAMRAKRYALVVLRNARSANRWELPAPGYNLEGSEYDSAVA